MEANKETELTKEQQELASKLTPLQRKFIIELVKPKTSQRQAYLRAGGTAKTENAQDQGASRMLSDDKVQAFYQSLMNSQTKSAIMTREEALERLSKSARVTIHDICTFSLEEVGKDEFNNPIMQTVWQMKNSEEIDPDVAASIKSVTFTKTGPKIELYDANGAIRQLSVMQGWDAPKKTWLTGSDDKPLEINSNVKAPEVAEALAGLMSKL